MNNTFAYHSIYGYVPQHPFILHFPKKQKCEQYWNNDLNKPYDAGRGFSVVTTGYRGFADYEVRDFVIRNVGYK